MFAHSEVVANIAIQHELFYLSLLIRLLTVKWFQVLLCITNNSINHHSFVYTQLNDQTVLFQTTEFSLSQQIQMVSSIAVYH